MSLNHEQRRITKERMIHDGDLLRSGATINELGCLVITKAQYLDLAQIESYAQQKESWLATFIDNVTGEDGETKVATTTVINAFKRAGLFTRRDIFVAGRSKVDDIRLFGAKSLKLVDAMLSNNLGITWQDTPTPVDIASVCADLSEVNSIAVAPQCISTDVAGETFADGYRAYLSVQDVLDEAVGTGRISPLLTDGWAKELLLQKLGDSQQAAVTFAQEFTAAKTVD